VGLLAGRIGQVHIHDNHGAFAAHNDSSAMEMKDEHLWPGDGTMDWAAVMSALGALPEDVPGVLEIAGDRDQAPEQVTRRAEAAFGKLAEYAQPTASAQNM